MFEKILKLLKNNKLIDLDDIRNMSPLVSAQSRLEEYQSVSDEKKLEEFLLVEREISDAFSKNEVLAFLGDFFQSVSAGLQSSTLDAKSVQQWRNVLRELLVGIEYSGEYVDSANKIKSQFDASNDLIECTQKTKDLLINYSTSLSGDHDEMHSYLLTIADKLQSIYAEIIETQDEFFSRESKKGSINKSFEQGIKQLDDTLKGSDDLDLLKKNLNQIVSVIQTKVIEEVEAEESETQVLENKIAGMSNKIKLLEDHAKDLEKTIHKKHMEAITDPLTGLYNRAAYVQALEKAWMKWEQEKVHSTMLVWDIDHFKMINDGHGHAAGDKVLQSVAKKLETGVRKGDILARFGGEEFVMLLVDKSLEEGAQLAERIRQLISSTEFTYKKQALHVTISCGVASFHDNDTPTSLFERADKALYRAKHGGRDRVESLKVA
ncbi:MAG: GGDEF domain-containing protein [Gammaproteobacteria bacterium]